MENKKNTIKTHGKPVHKEESKTIETNVKTAEVLLFLFIAITNDTIAIIKKTNAKNSNMPLGSTIFIT